MRPDDERATEAGTAHLVAVARHHRDRGETDLAIMALGPLLTGAAAHEGALLMATNLLRAECRFSEARALVDDAGAERPGRDRIDERATVERLRAELATVMAALRGTAVDTDPRDVPSILTEQLQAHGTALPPRERLLVSRHLRDVLADDDAALAVLESIEDGHDVSPSARLLESVLRFDRLDFAGASVALARSGAGPPVDHLASRLRALRALTGWRGEPMAGEALVQRVIDVVAAGHTDTTVPAAGHTIPRIAVIMGSIHQGGAETQGCRLALLLRSTGIDVLVMHDDRLPATPELVAQLERAGVQVARFADGAAPTHDHGHDGHDGHDGGTDHEDVVRDLLTLLDERASMLGLHRSLRAWAPSATYIVGDAGPLLERAGLVALAAGVPRVVLSATTLSPQDRPDLHESLAYRRPLAFARAMMRGMLRHPRVQLVANCETSIASFEAWAGAPVRPARVVPDYVDGPRFVAESSMEIDPPWPPGATVVGGVFRLYPVKRPLLWLEVARLLTTMRPDIHFALVGDGPLAGAVREASSDLPNVHLLGHRNPAAPWISRFATLLLTSCAEGLSIASLEAQALGVPVVLSNVGGVAESLVPGETGFLVERIDDREAYATAVLATLDPTWRAAANVAAPRLIRRRNSPDRHLAAVLPALGIDPAALASSAGHQLI